MRSFSRVAKIAAFTSAMLLMASCSGQPTANKPSDGGSAQPTGEIQEGGNVTVALRTPTWILPISAPGKTQGENGIFINMLYKGFFDYKLDADNEFNLDERSLAEEPKVSDDGLTYELKMKPSKWSDGEEITTRDVEFWWNILNANKEEWSGYRKGNFPDNIAEFKIIDDHTVSFTTTEVFNPGWFVDNQLGSVRPLPQQVWGKTSVDGEIGDYDRDLDGAKAIFAMLTEASKDLQSYATNPLWKVVNGPFQLDSFVPNGEVKLVANKQYTGSDKPKLDSVTLRPFTSDDAQFNVLRSGGIDYGYIPAGSINQRSTIESQGYVVEPWAGWSITYMPFNFANPKSGPIFKQKYVRQAMQMLIDQEAIAKTVWAGTATPTCGPVPQKPGAAGSTEGCAYKFDPAGAKKLLESHGWKINAGDVSICEKPGTGDDQCGEGVEKGAKLQFKMISQSGFPATTRMMTEINSRFSEVGIKLEIQEVPDSVAVSQKCAPGEACDWDLSFFGSQSSWYYPVYASGDRLFQTDAPVNLGSYSNPEADKLIEATLRAKDSKALKEYNDFLAEDLPVLWMPNPVAQISAWKKDLYGISPQDPMLGMFPQDWAHTK